MSSCEIRHSETGGRVLVLPPESRDRRDPSMIFEAYNSSPIGSNFHLLDVLECNPSQISDYMRISRLPNQAFTEA